jgi:hypothetical protein
MTGPAALHPFTPGAPAYVAAKAAAVGGLIALRMVLARRGRRKPEAAEGPGPVSSSEARRREHPVSRRKAKRRRRRR